MSQATTLVPTRPALDRSTAAALAILFASVSGFLFTAGFRLAFRAADGRARAAVAVRT
jgi:hypothetical protein